MADAVDDRSDEQKFRDLLDRANALVKAHKGRVGLQNELKDLYFITPLDAFKNKGDYVKEVYDPTADDTVNWLSDVLAVNEPQFEVTIPEEAMSAPADQGGPLDALEMAAPDLSGVMGGSLGGGVPPPAGDGNEMRGDGAALMGMGAMSGPSALMAAPPSNKELAQTIENIIRSAIKHNDLSSESALQSDMVKQACLYGMVSVKLGDLRQDPRSEKRKLRHAGKPPFRFRAILPTNVFWEVRRLRHLCSAGTVHQATAGSHRVVSRLREPPELGRRTRTSTARCCSANGGRQKRRASGSSARRPTNHRTAAT